MWNYLILILLLGISPSIMNHWLLPKDTLLLMPLILSIIAPYLLLGLIILIITVIFNMVQTATQCTSQANKTASWGFTSGLKLGLLTTLTSLSLYLITNLYPLISSPFLSISILPYGAEISQAFFVSMAGAIGYRIGRIFIDIC